MPEAVVSLAGARLAFGDRVLWDQLDLAVSAGEFIAVLGPNGTGKTSLLKVLLGQLPLTAGSALIDGRPVQAGSNRIGYVPQHRAVDRGLSLRGRDLVGLGVDGHRWGLAPRTRAARRHRQEAVDRALDNVYAGSLARVAVGLMSGGELQRVRIAQALANEPMLLLCDEPLLNLDPGNARLVARLINEQRQSGTAVMFVTHEVNPVLPYVDKVLYLADGRFRIGTVAEVMNSATLSELYGAEIEVIKVGNRYVVIGEHVDQSGHTHGHADD